jgi:centromere-localized protein 2
MEEESEKVLEEIQELVGGMSDLRYGRLANSGLREEVLEGLGRLESACGGDR